MEWHGVVAGLPVVGFGGHCCWAVVRMARGQVSWLLLGQDVTGGQKRKPSKMAQDRCCLY